MANIFFTSVWSDNSKICNAFSCTHCYWRYPATSSLVFLFQFHHWVESHCSFIWISGVCCRFRRYCYLLLDVTQIKEFCRAQWLWINSRAHLKSNHPLPSYLLMNINNINSTVPFRVINEHCWNFQLLPSFVLCVWKDWVVGCHHVHNFSLPSFAPFPAFITFPFRLSQHFHDTVLLAPVTFTVCIKANCTGS